MNGSVEYIKCPAVRFKIFSDDPKFNGRWVQIMGETHREIYSFYRNELGFKYSNEHRMGSYTIQGFWTSNKRFVDRKEAYSIARNAGQIIDPEKSRWEYDILYDHYIKCDLSIEPYKLYVPYGY